MSGGLCLSSGVILFTACSSALKPIRDDETLPVVDTVRDPVVALFDNQAQPHDPAEPITEMQSSETEASSKRSDVNERSVSFLQTRSGSARAGTCPRVLLYPCSSWLQICAQAGAMATTAAAAISNLGRKCGLEIRTSPRIQ